MLKVHITDHEPVSFTVHWNGYANFFLPFWATAVFGSTHYNAVTVLCLIRQNVDQKQGSRFLLKPCYICATINLQLKVAL